MQKAIVHFGAGALGKGLVMPVLHDSGFSITAVDASREVVEHLKKNKAYKMKILNDPSCPIRQIPVSSALLLGEDDDAIVDAIRSVDIVTTSVRRENLGGVARLVYLAWGENMGTQKAVICCENIEGVSAVFTGLLAKYNDKGLDLSHIRVPDTVVDRGCGYDPGDPMVVMTEQFYEIGVDAKTLPDTGIQLIPSLEDVEKDFWRKRFMLNTRVDLTAYFGIEWKFAGYGDAMYSPELQAYLAPYLELVRFALQSEFGMSDAEFEKWKAFYSNRSSRSREESNSRPMTAMARGIWAKLDYRERIVYPLILAKKNGHDIAYGIRLVADIVRAEIANDRVTCKEADSRCHQMWCIDDTGKYLYEGVFNLLNP